MNGNLATVAAIYEAFGRGDVPAILEKLTDDIRCICGRSMTRGRLLASATTSTRRSTALLRGFQASRLTGSPKDR